MPFRFRIPSLQLKLVLLLNAVVFIIAVFQTQLERVMTRAAFEQYVILWAVTLIGIGFCLLAWLRPVMIEQAVGELWRWISAARWRVWITALGIFLSFNLFADRFSILPYEADLLRALGCINAIFLLLTQRRGDISAPAVPSVRQEHIAGLAIFLVALLTSVWQFMAAPPTPPADDAALYFTISQQLLGRDTSGMINLEQSTVFVYGYPTFIALTRLIYDNLLGLVIIQHLIRAASAFAAYWLLRKTDHAFALVIGLMIAVLPVTAHMAHTALMDSLYSSVLLFLALIAYRAARSSGRLAIGLLLLTGGLCILALFVRFTAQLIVIPVLVGILLLTRRWQAVLWVGGGAAGAFLLITLAGKLWTPDYTLGMRSTDVYLASPLLYYDIYNPSNGPQSAGLQQILQQEDCQFNVATTFIERYRALNQCKTRYLNRNATSISLTGVYFEGITAQAGKFVEGYITEMRQFITHPDWAIRMPQIRFGLRELMPLPGTTEQCFMGYAERGLSSTILQNYGCNTYSIQAGSSSINALSAWSFTFTDLLMPYRLMGWSIGVRFWGAVVLLVFALLENRAAVRPLLVMSLLIIGYHALITPFSQLVTARYVFIVGPLFAIISGAIYTGVGREILRLYQHYIRAVVPAHLVVVCGIVIVLVGVVSATLSTNTDLPLRAAQTWVQHPVNLQFDRAIRLIGYRFDETPTLAGEARRELILTWQTLQPVPVDYQMFVSVLDGDGASLWQEDFQVAAENLPTSAWPVNTLMNQSILLPPELPRPLDLRLGLYQLDTLQRAEVTTIEGVWLAEPGDNSIALIIR